MLLGLSLGILLGLFQGLDGSAYWGSCPDNMYPCVGGNCLPCASRCNRMVECADTSDEYQCSPPLVCAPGHQVFNLDNGFSFIAAESQIIAVIGNIVTLDFGFLIINMTLGCGVPPYIENGEVTLNGTDSSFGAIAQVTCINGYQTCDNEIKCYCSGTWALPVCSPVPMTPASMHRCYRCLNSGSNDNCNMGMMQSCQPDEVCETILGYDGNGTRTISKGCGPSNMNRGCEMSGGQSRTCDFQCKGDLCDKLLPPDCDDCGNTEMDNGDCMSEHGDCTMMRHNQVASLRASDCAKYCRCAKRPDNTYQWVVKSCEMGYAMDNKCGKCNKVMDVVCHGTQENNCSMAYGICNENEMVQKPNRGLGNTNCKKYCEASIKRSGPHAMPVFTWEDRNCPNGKKFDEGEKRCKPQAEVHCTS